jgi:hypothetical protein
MRLDLSVTKRLGPGFALDVTLAAPPGVTMIFGASGRERRHCSAVSPA